MNNLRTKRKICFYARSGQNELFARIGRKLEKLGFKTVYIVQNSFEEEVVRSFHPDGSIYNLTAYIEKNWDNTDLLESLPLDGIETKYDIPSLWSLLYSDRFLVKYSHDEAVKFIKLHVAFMEEIVLKEDIGVLVNEVVALFSAYIMYYAARLYGFRYLSLIVPRNFAMEKFHFSNEWHGGNEELNNYYHGDDLTKEELQAAELFIDQLVRSGVKPEYAKVSRPRLNLAQIKEIGRYLFSFTGAVSRQNYELFHERANLYLYSLKNLIKYHRQKKYYLEPDYDRPYYFLPLHFQPEATTLVYAPNYEKQSLALDLVAKKIPGDALLYVKEHHSHVGHREMEFYRNLNRYPNVRLISPWVDSHRLIRNSQGVIVITSTVGWEAMMYGKPVFLLGRVFYESFKYIHRIDNIDDLTATLKAAGRQAPSEENYRRELVKYVAAYLKSLKPGNYYLSDPSVLKPENIDRLSEALADEITTPKSVPAVGSKGRPDLSMDNNPMQTGAQIANSGTPITDRGQRDSRPGRQRTKP